MKKMPAGFLRPVLRWPMPPISALALLLWATLAANAQTNSVLPSRPPCCAEVTHAGPFTDRSVYQLDSDWTTDAGQTMKLGQLRGEPQVVAMIYCSCPYACPLLVQEMQQLAQSLPANARTNVGFLLVTFDPDRDTTGALRAYRATRKLPEPQWKLLRGSPEDTRELALVLGLKYRQDAGGQFAHSNLITILDAKGEIAWQQTGLAGSPDQLAERLSGLLKTTAAGASSR
jgi:protein SCO1/2